MSAERGLLRAGALAALAAALLTIVWLAMLLVLPVLPDEATLEEQLYFVAEHQGAYIALYTGAFLLVLVQIPFLLALTALAHRRAGGQAYLWGVLALFYVILSLWAYWTQLTVVRGLTDIFVNSEDAVLRASALAVYLTWGYTGRLAAAPYAIDSLGYLLYSLALLGFGMILVRGPGVDLVSGGLLLLASVSGLVGILGYLVQIALIEDGIVLSGAFVMPAFFTLAYRYWRETRAD